jgi:uncharacterized protein YciI
MPHFVVQYLDRPGASEARARLREAHIAYRKGLGAAMVLAGPLFDDMDGSPTIGSLVIIEALDKAMATRIASADPYVDAGVFREVRVFGYRIAALNPPSGA